MKAYISGSAAISAQLSFENSFPWAELKIYQDIMPAIEPDYKEYITPIKMRRMNKIVRMGIAASASCLKASSLSKPEAIITSTGWGCLSDTFKFLDEMIEKKEETLSPATFIQSTHNTVGGQIALFLECQEYNNVFVNHTQSFEHGLLDALMLITEGKENVLVGGIDEITSTDYELKKKAGYWKNSISENTSLLTIDGPGTMPGEGASFFLLTQNPSSQSKACIEGVFFTTENSLQDSMFSGTGVTLKDIDLVISGYNGDSRLKGLYNNAIPANFFVPQICYYKHLCGEFDTASAFGLWIANEILKGQTIPDYLFLDGEKTKPMKIDRILIHHFSEPYNHAYILVSKTGI
jgi:3-oxoacyl-[acyl-carrier-protein] synthase II